MTDAATDAAPETEPNRPLPIPPNAQEYLRLMLEARGTAFTDAEDRLVAGTPARPGPVLPGSDGEFLIMCAKGLLTGENGLLMTTRLGRHLARHGSLETFDDRLMDYDLAAWGRGDIDYQLDELAEGVEGYCHEIVLTRGEALVVLLKRNVITPGEARRDV